MLKERKFLGQTVDNVHRTVDVFADSEKVYAVYNLGTAEEYTAEAVINKIKSNPSEYIYTPYIEFI